MAEVPRATATAATPPPPPAQGRAGCGPPLQASSPQRHPSIGPGCWGLLETGSRGKNRAPGAARHHARGVRVKEGRGSADSDGPCAGQGLAPWDMRGGTGRRRWEMRDKGESAQCVAHIDGGGEGAQQCMSIEEARAPGKAVRCARRHRRRRRAAALWQVFLWQVLVPGGGSKVEVTAKRPEGTGCVRAFVCVCACGGCAGNAAASRLGRVVALVQWHCVSAGTSGGRKCDLTGEVISRGRQGAPVTRQGNLSRHERGRAPAGDEQSGC